MSEPFDEKHIQKALGASRVVPVKAPSQGPLDLLELKADLGRRLKSAGGRPSDPEWSIRRLVPFKEDKWNELEGFARQWSEDGQKVSPSQLAAVLIEEGLARLKAS